MYFKRLYLFFAFLFFSQFAQAQLSNFTLTVTRTNETCTSNGSLSFAVSNTTPGATMLFSIYLLPSTTPISVQSATSISGLSAGHYRVVATQSQGNQSGTQQQDIEIVNSIQPLTYQIAANNEVCGNDGRIVVNVTNGTPLNYEIFAGPMTRPLQSSNVFTGLTAGIYQIRVFDVCHQGVVQTFTLLRSDNHLNFTLTNPFLANCTTVSIGFNFQTVLPSPAGAIKYPLQIVTTLHPPTGPTQTYTGSINAGTSFAQLVTYYPNQTYTYSFTITDGCGTVYTLNGTIQNIPIGTAGFVIGPDDCTHKIVAFSSINAISLISAPAGFTPTLPVDYTSQILNHSVSIDGLIGGTYVFSVTDLCGNVSQVTVTVVIDNVGPPPYNSQANRTCIDATIYIYEISQLTLISAPAAYTLPLPHDYTSLINGAHYAPLIHMPVGTYLFSVLDRCGNPIQMQITVTPFSQAPSATVLEGCDTGMGSVQLTGQFSTLTLTSAPAGYPGPLPVNLMPYVINSGTKLSLGSIPPGNYVFQSTNPCNQPYTTNVTVQGYQDNTNITVTANCGSFNLQLNHTSNNNNGLGLWLQKYDPVNNVWVHPLTNVVYPDNSLPTTTNSVSLTNNTVNYNLAFAGHFRILKSYRSFDINTSQPIDCIKVIDEFDFSGEPKINDVFSVSCGSTFEVIVDAEGNSALIYRITTKNGQPFLIENGNSSLFSGLAPAVYNFQVEDACGNRVNSQFEILNPNPMAIIADLSCDGESASLTAPNFSFLTYRWWKGNNTTAVLSTTNALNFPSFNSALNSGIYHVQIIYAGNPNSCLNQVLDYTIPPNSAPHAGNDNTVSYCGRQGVINLNTLLSGTFDNAGTWTETTSSGALTNNLWNSSNAGVPFGTYQFKYTVSGGCGLADEASISITIKAIPQVPTASADPIVCEGQDLNLFATAVANAGYHWEGPNGFLSTLQNPALNSVSPDVNGTYTVYTTQNGCQSGESSVEVLVNPLPNFELIQNCVGKDYQVRFTRLDEVSFDESNSTFSWTGPNGFSSNQNLITITGGELGVYSLTITNQYGCEATNNIEVVRNVCFIPNAISPNNDEFNESLNLAGFGVSKLEIYNRWGRMVYEKSNYSDEWHGQNMNGGILPDSTYYYIIKLSTEEIKTGWIFLNRE